MAKQIGEFTLVNEEKLDRAINGTMSRGGTLVGGVGKEAPDEVLLAKYDELGGLILKGQLKVKTGSFFNFQEKKAWEVPQIKFEMAMNGRVMVVDETKAQAIQLAKEELASVENEVLESQEEKPKRKLGRKKKVESEE